MQQRSEEWFETRKGRVTASMVGAILGLSPYMTRDDAMRAMVREAIGEEREFKGNVATEYGSHHEDGALVEYRMETQHEVEVIGFVEFEDWLLAGPIYKNDQGALVRVYCPYSQRESEAPRFDKAFEKYHVYARMQMEMHATEAKRCHFYQWAPNGTRLEIVHYEPEWIAEKLPRIREFHEEFKAETEKSSDFYRGPVPVKIDTPEAAKKIREWDEINDSLEKLAARKVDLLNDIVRLSGEQNALFAGRKVQLCERSTRGKPSRFWKVS